MYKKLNVMFLIYWIVEKLNLVSQTSCHSPLHLPNKFKMIPLHTCTCYVEQLVCHAFQIVKYTLYSGI